jgi:Skp family chaperone for outer membrane proteins
VLKVKFSCLPAILAASVLWIGVVSTPVPAWAQAGQPAARRSSPSIAVIDIGHLFKNYTLFSKAMEDIKADFEQFEKEARERQDQIRKMAENLKATPAGSPEYRNLEEQIAAATTQLRLDMGRKQKERVEEEAKIYFNAYRRVEWEVQKFADRFGIDLVVRFNSEQMDPSKPESVLQGINRFVVYHRSLNITDQILKNLNDQAGPAPGTAIKPPIPGATGPRTQ